MFLKMSENVTVDVATSQGDRGECAPSKGRSALTEPLQARGRDGAAHSDDAHLLDSMI
jgi:hypothetical protein